MDRTPSPEDEAAVICTMVILCVLGAVLLWRLI